MQFHETACRPIFLPPTPSPAHSVYVLVFFVWSVSISPHTGITNCNINRYSDGGNNYNTTNNNTHEDNNYTTTNSNK